MGRTHFEAMGVPQQGEDSYIFIVCYLALGTALVFIFPRSLLAFLLFISSALLIFYMQLNKAFSWA